MIKLTPRFPSSELDVKLADRLAALSRACLSLVVLISVIGLLGWVLRALGLPFPIGWNFMTAIGALTVLLSSLSLYFSEPRHPRWMHSISLLLAVLLALLAAILFLASEFHLNLALLIPPEFRLLLPARMSPQSASAFVLLGLSILLLRVRNRFAVRLADLLAMGLGLMMMILVSGRIFGTMSVFALPPQPGGRPVTLFCLLLLTAVVFVRRAENGVFSILLGRGIGSRIARMLSPVLLVLPFLREMARAHLLRLGRMPSDYTTSILASLASVLSLLLLLFLAWCINGMEMEIQDLSLRDELTGLYNLRGFRLLAEQAMRLANRAHLPFSVLFIDLDDLKQTNDAFGHQAGSAFLVETAEILRASFRESDVMGRIGGDEFAVAGQFGHGAIALAAQRLAETSLQRNANSGRRNCLSFSVGHVTSEGTPGEPLDELLAKADQAMYDQKRRKKITVT